MKMYDKQTFQVGGTQWRFDKGIQPQGTLSATAKDGAQLAGIIPYDWSKPVDAPNNAVVFTRSLSGNEWTSSQPMDLKAAIKKGSNHVSSYHQDKQIAQIEGFFKQREETNQQAKDKQPLRPSNDRKQGKLPKFKTLEALKDWQQEQKAKGQSKYPDDHKNKNQGMG